ncbi:MAG: FAD-binding domain [Planctomycetota bacterium]
MRIAIVGAGIAGPTLAWWLRRYGFEPVLYELAPRLRKGGYVVDFWGVGYDVADRMGLKDEIHHRGYDFEKLLLVDARGKASATLDLELFRSIAGGRFVSIARSDLSSVIWEACSGIETHFGAEIESIEQDDTCVRLGLRSGETETFDLLVGADGLHSQVRKLVFGQDDQFEKQLGYYVAAFRDKGYASRDELAYVAHCAPHRQVARFGLRNDETVFFFIFASHLMDAEPLTEESQRRALLDVFSEMEWETPDILKRLQSSDGFYFDRVSQIRMDHWTNHRVALVGDAAACVSLLAGEGTGLAMTEAYVLAGELSTEADFTTAFQNYETRMRSFLRQKQESARGTAGFFAPKSRVHMMIRNWSIRALKVPLLARLLVGRSFRDDFDLPGYAP